MDETISLRQFGREFLIKESAAEALLSGHPPRDAKKNGIRYWSWPLFLLLQFGYGSDNAVIQSHA